MQRLLASCAALTLGLALPAAANAAEDEPAASEAGSDEEPPKDEDADDDDDDEVKDEVRMRGGFSLNGGMLIMPDIPDAIGGAVSLGIRLGVQFTHYWSVYYQGTPLVGIITDQTSSAAATAMVYNSFLAGLTLGHFFDLGFGPSVDIFAVGAANSSGAVGGDTGVNFGLHSRAAFNIGGLDGDGPDRSGFALGVDFHPVFFDKTVLMTFTVGIGGEWY